tara:strand:- start:437 stop:1441 length:1005 start_codon:yes stop_codon:yes gene_type:complete
MGVRATSQANFDSQSGSFSNNFASETGGDFKGEGIAATGGTKASPGDGYTYHLFTSPGLFTITGAGEAGTNEIQYLMVAGGGGGGYDKGGGGGAGGFVPGTVTAVAGAYPVILGPGGGGSTAGGSRGTNGGETAFGGWPGPAVPINTVGGGGGGGSSNSPAQIGGTGSDYGSGGGAWYNNSGGVMGPQPVPGIASASPGNLGTSPIGNGGAGGGAGGSPGPGQPRSTSNDGKTLPWIPATYGFAQTNEPGSGGGGYFGGGGAGGGNTVRPPAGTRGHAGAGMGLGDPSPSGSTLKNAMTNSGSGGGGGAGDGPDTKRRGGQGGPGVFLCRYPVG